MTSPMTTDLGHCSPSMASRSENCPFCQNFPPIYTHLSIFFGQAEKSKRRDQLFPCVSMQDHWSGSQKEDEQSPLQDGEPCDSDRAFSSEGRGRWHHKARLRPLSCRLFFVLAGRNYLLTVIRRRYSDGYIAYLPIAR